MNKKLLSILVCPICKGYLNHQSSMNELICKFDRLAFPIRENIPVMLPNEARYLCLEEVEKIK